MSSARAFRGTHCRYSFALIIQPFNAAYTWFNSSDTLIIPDPVNTFPNPYKGGAFQQASSGVTETSEIGLQFVHVQVGSDLRARYQTSRRMSTQATYSPCMASSTSPALRVL